jgi:hypothetical protein
MYGAGRRLMGRSRAGAGACGIRIDPRVNFEGVQNNLRIDAAIAREVARFPLVDSLQFDDPFFLAVLESLVRLDAHDVTEVEVLTGELDPHNRHLEVGWLKHREGEEVPRVPLVKP